MTEAEARDHFAAVHAPQLDALRARIPQMRTSELLALDALRARIPQMRTSELLALVLPDSPTLGAALDEDLDACSNRDEMLGIATAAALALTDEIDRRIPSTSEVESMRRELAALRAIVDRLATGAVTSGVQASLLAALATRPPGT